MVNFIDTKISSPVRQVKSKVELFSGSTLLNTFSNTDKLKSFTIERAGDNTKFFGFTVCQKLNLKIIDTKREIAVNAGSAVKVWLTADKEYCNPFPLFYVTETHRDAITGELSITAYDALYKAAQLPISVLKENGLTIPYTLNDILLFSSKVLGLTLNLGNLNIFQEIKDTLALSYPNGANFGGSETIRDVINAACEITGSIAYITNKNELRLTVPHNTTSPATEVFFDRTISLTEKPNRRLSRLFSVTELGDNYTNAITESGSTQYIRNNPFWDLREDRNELLDKLLLVVGGLTIGQLEVEWRGDYRLEIGDKIAFKNLSTYLINDTLSYDGSLSQKLEWNFEQSEEETAANPTTLSDNLKNTYAKVDKVNQTVDIVVQDSQTNSEKLAALELNTDGISATVTDLKKTSEENIGKLQSDVEEVKNNVALKMDSEGVDILINQKLEGIDSFSPQKGFTFDKQGLTITEDGKEMKTVIDEDGMKVFKDTTQVLTANNAGVKAVDLTAIGYLSIGNSRFEDYDGGTGCFFVG